MVVFRRIFNIISAVVVAGLLILSMLLAGVRLLGFQVFTVLSGSMEPQYPVGSLIYVREVESPGPGDVITFLLDGDTVATHRIVEVLPDGRYRTKGDANPVEDGTPVPPQNVLGSPVFNVPWLGYLAAYIQSPPGTYVAVSVGALLFLVAFLPEMLFEKKGRFEK